MEESQKPSAFRDFSDSEKGIIKKFLSSAEAELQRDPSPLDVDDVLERLTNAVSLDMRTVTRFQDHGLTMYEVDPSSTDRCTIDIDLPVKPTASEFMSLALDLDSHAAYGDKSDLFDPLIQSEVVLFLPRLLDMIAKRYDLQNLVVLESLKSFLESLNLKLRVNGKETDFLAVSLSYAADPAFLYQAHCRAMIPLAGYTVAERLEKHVAGKSKVKKSWSLERMLDACMRLFLRSENVRQSLLQLLQNTRLSPQARFAQSIAKQGYRTLCKTNAMSEHHQWVEWQNILRVQGLRNSEIHARSLSIELKTDIMKAIVEGRNPFKCTEIPDARDYFLDPFPIPDPDACLDYLDDDAFKLWHKAKAFLASHEPSPPQKILDTLDPEACRSRLKKLEDMQLWSALAGEECSILSRIYSEVKRLPYGFDAVDREEAERQGTISGTPRFVAEESRVNCLSGPWLMTSLALQCGIPYERIFFCDVNRHDYDLFGSHGKLLIHLRDNSFAFLDSARSTNVQPLPLSLIPDRNERKKLVDLSLRRIHDAHSPQKEKWVGDSVHLHIDTAFAELGNFPRDFRVLAPDQAFSSRSLLNVGIGFERKNRNSEAMHAYEMGLVIEPANADLLCRAGALALRSGESERADRYLNSAIRSNGGHLHAAYYFALLLIDRGQYEMAKRGLVLLSEDKRRVWGDSRFQDRVQQTMTLLGLKMGLHDEMNSSTLNA